MATIGQQSPKQKLIIKFGGKGVTITPQHYKESFRCKTLESAIEVLSKRNSKNILNATYYARTGQAVELINNPE